MILLIIIVFILIIFILIWYIPLRLYVYSLFQILTATYTTCFNIWICLLSLFRLRPSEFNGTFIAILIFIRTIIIFLCFLHFVKSHQSFLFNFLLLNCFLMLLQWYLELIHQSKASILDNILSCWAASLKSLGRYPLILKNILKQIRSRLN